MEGTVPRLWFGLSGARVNANQFIWKICIFRVCVCTFKPYRVCLFCISVQDALVVVRCDFPTVWGLRLGRGIVREDSRKIGLSLFVCVCVCVFWSVESSQSSHPASTDVQSFNHNTRRTRRAAYSTQDTNRAVFLCALKTGEPKADTSVERRRPTTRITPPCRRVFLC